MTILTILVALVLAAMAYVRFKPVTPDQAGPLPSPAQPGDYPSAGGFYAVRPLSDLPPDVLTRLQAIALEAPRTTQISGDPNTTPMVFETRSLIWAFPDINTIWTADGNLHVYAHLVYGKSDLGMNRARILGWLQRLDTVE